MTSGWLWEDFGKTLGRLWENFGKFLGRFWEDFGKTFGRTFGKTFGRLWEDFGKTLGRLRNDLGMTSEWWLWDDFRMTSGWLKENSESNQKKVSNQTLSYCRSLKYFVLFSLKFERSDYHVELPKFSFNVREWHMLHVDLKIKTKCANRILFVILIVKFDNCRSINCNCRLGQLLWYMIVS